MKKKHNSHYIFGLLGILVLIFFVVIGTQYFQSEYLIDEAEVSETAQAYADGKITANPFVNDIDGNKEFTGPTQKFGSEVFEFSFPAQYTIRIINASTVDVIPQGVSSDALYRSPDLRVMLASSDQANLTDNSKEAKQIRIDGDLWEKRVDQDERGGTVWYQRSLADESVLSVSYQYADTNIGSSFNELQQVYGDSYLLSANEQNQLALDIIKSLEIK